MKIFLVVVVLIFTIPAFVQAAPNTSNLSKVEVNSNHSQELSSSPRKGTIKGNILDQLRDSNQTLQTRSTTKGKLSRYKNRLRRATPAQNCDPNDIQCMGSQELNRSVPR